MAKIFQPTVVIGLGGTGKGIILALQKIIAENSEKGMVDYPFLQFLSLDTDSASTTGESNIVTIDERELKINPSTESFPLKTNFSLIPDLEKDFPEIAAWFPSSFRHSLTPAELDKGAGQKKAIGRFTFAWNANDLYTRLQNMLANPVSLSDVKSQNVGDNLSKFTNVFICGSLCGGTGAGTFLDVAYLVRYIATTITTQQIFIYGMFALSSLFEGISGDAQIKPNCYASLLELDHFMNELNFSNPYRRFFPAYKNFSPDYSRSADNRPFDFPFVFDKSNMGGIALDSPEAFSQMVARFIYLLPGHEVSESWQTTDSNVRNNLDTTYKKSLLNKPNNYRSMGTFSVMFPKRMTIQLCAYRLAQDYFKIILDDSYNPKEIETLATRFLNSAGINPQGETIIQRFQNYRTDDGGIQLITEYIDGQKSMRVDDILNEKVPKGEITQAIRQWESDMEKDVASFKQQNLVTARNIREGYIETLNKEISRLLDLRLQKDEGNLNADGEPRVVRGSLVRAQKVLSTVESRFTDAKELFRKRLDEARTSVIQTKNAFEDSLNSLKEAAESFVPAKKKVQERINDSMDKARDYLIAQTDVFVDDWIGQLLTDIKENEIPRYNGVMKESQTMRKALDQCVLNCQTLSEEVQKFLDDNHRYIANPLCDVIFDFKTDVEETVNKVKVDQGEDHIWEKLSDLYKSDNGFGPTYSNMAKQNSTQILRCIINGTEKLFFAPVAKISIADKLLANPEKLNLLSNGNYLRDAKIYLNIDGGELSKVNINLNQSTFLAITIPNEYTGKDCENLKGTLNSVSGKHICPVEADPDKFRNDPCPLFGRCLKRTILQHAEGNLAIIPTDDTAEINIVNTVAGFPLHSLSTP